MPLFLKQKKVIRIICKAKYHDHTNVLFEKLQVPKLFDIVELKTAILMFKAFHNLLPLNLQKLFIVSSNNRYCTKQNSYFKQNYVRTTRKQMCISVCGVKLWNTVKNEIKNCKKVYIFKKMYKKQLLSTYV